MNPHAGAGRGDPAVYTRRRAIAVATAIVIPTFVYAQLKGRRVQSDALPVVSSDPASPTTPASIATTTSVASARKSQIVAFDHAVGRGMSDGKVGLVQDRLRQLGFDPGPSDSVFGAATERAVWAFEKFILDMDPSNAAGVVTPEMWQRMNEPIDIRPRRSGPGTHLEILLPQQVAVLFADNQARLITHVSTGTGDEWCDVVLVDNDGGTQSEQGICGVAVTPGGVFHFERRVVGWRNSKLGRLYNPVYFNYGIAVHGASNVPNYPASHGCVRMPMHIAEYFPSLVRDGDLVYVFDGVEEPETYGAQLPVFDYPDPSYTTTTSTSTTTTTRPAPTTTHAPSTATTHDDVSTTTTSTSTTVMSTSTTVAG